MSYILDALKKADAQRERDPARGIHAQPAALAPARRSDESRAPWVWLAAAAGVAVLGWFLYQDHPGAAGPAQVAVGNSAAPAARPAVTVPAPLSPAPPALVVTVPPAQQAAVQRESPAAVVLPPPAPAAAVPITPPAAHRRERTPAAAAVGRAPAPVAVSSAPTATAQSAAAAAASSARAPNVMAPAAAAAAPASTEAAAPMATSLPPDAPKLAISGGVYSGNRAQRMLIVNGQVVNEGADLGGGVVLEEIRPKAAVLRFRGARYSVAF